MFELGDYLIGIYKTFNCTQSVTINPRLMGKVFSEEKSDVEDGINTLETSLQNGTQEVPSSENNTREKRDEIEASESQESQSEVIDDSFEEPMDTLG